MSSDRDAGLQLLEAVFAQRCAAWREGIEDRLEEWGRAAGEETAMEIDPLDIIGELGLDLDDEGDIDALSSEAILKLTERLPYPDMYEIVRWNADNETYEPRLRRSCIEYFELESDEEAVIWNAYQDGFEEQVSALIYEALEDLLSQGQ